MKKTFKGRPVIAGSLQGRAVVSETGLNILASFQKDILSKKKVIRSSDQNNASLFGKALTGKILCLPRTIGSTTGGMVDGQSLHYRCLRRLIEAVASPERRIGYYQDLITRFPDSMAEGSVFFLLGKEYERVGDWDLAVKSYAKYLPYFGSSIPGYPDAFQYARNIVDFYNSPKDWTYEDLGALVGKVKAALAAGDSYKLRSYRAKVNFFAMSWHQDETEGNSQVPFDFAEFMSNGRIYSAEALDPSSGARDAYLKTWGWSERISTWYLYFRKIYFPADPEIHGRWEWAGIYFGEKMQ